ncbi:hypothetical protein FB446DRAFT_786140 [Lentinula raphanica]|nr:hypothetical protein FB446DRAFT_786140 [Lentinula raphanica]
MRLHITCSVFAAVLLGVIPVIASPLPPDNEHSLFHKRATNAPIRFGVVRVIGDKKEFIPMTASEEERQQGDLALGLGPSREWVAYPNDGKAPYTIPPPKKDPDSRFPDKEYYKRSGMILYSTKGTGGAEIEQHMPYNTLVDRNQLASFMTPKFLHVLQEIEYDFDLQKGKSCALAVIAYCIHQEYLDINDFRKDEIKHVIEVMNKLQPESHLPPVTSADSAQTPNESMPYAGGSA